MKTEFVTFTCPECGRTTMKLLATTRNNARLLQCPVPSCYHYKIAYLDESTVADEVVDVVG